MKNELGKNFSKLKTLYRFPQIRTGWGLFAICLLMVLGVIASAVFHPMAGFAVLAIAPVLKFKKDGLSAEDANYKYLEMLEKRFEGFPEIMTKEEIEAQIKSITNAEYERRVTELLKDIDPVKLKQFLSDDAKGVKAILLAQGEAITALKGQINTGGEKPQSIKEQVAAWHAKNKDVILRIKSGEKIDVPVMELKVASPMTPANTITGASAAFLPVPEFEAGIHDLRRIQPTFWDYIVKGATGSATYVWVNKKNPLGAAAFIGPGVAKPGISFELVPEISNAKKIAASDKIATELLDDIPGMASYVQDELSYQVKKKVNTTLMTGVLSATVPAGIQTISVPFSAVGMATANPNIMDCIRAIVAQLRIGFFDGPITVFVNPIDAANMDMAKAATSGVYILPPFVTSDGRAIAGAIVVEDNNIPAGSVQGAALDLFKVKIYKSFSVSWGWENDDFTKNLITIIGEMRLHSYHSDNDAGAFIFDTFANIQALIAA